MNNNIEYIYEELESREFDEEGNIKEIAKGMLIEKEIDELCLVKIEFYRNGRDEIHTVKVLFKTIYFLDGSMAGSFEVLEIDGKKGDNYPGGWNGVLSSWDIKHEMFPIGMQYYFNLDHMPQIISIDVLDKKIKIYEYVKKNE